jgi:predicted nucleotidyltransferase
MENRLSGSVKIFYPVHDLQALEKLIASRVNRLKQLLPVKLVLIFGSYARGNHTAASDIDLLVVYSGEARSDAYNRVVEVIDLPRLEPHVYTETECKQLKRIISRMRKGGRIVYDESSA